MTFHLQAEDGHTIEVQSWLPSQEASQVLVLSHGMTEHLGRYQNFIDACLKQGIGVYGANHRGHGPNTPHPGHFADQDGWHKIRSDLDQVIDKVTAIHGQPPILVGHSMGSFLARHYAVDHGEKLKGLVLSGSNHQSSWPMKFGLFAVSFEKHRVGAENPSKLLSKLSFGNFNNAFQPIRTNQDWLCSEKEIVDAYIADPHCGFTCTPAFWDDLLHGLIAISHPGAFQKIPTRLPVYILSGLDDPVSRFGWGVSDLARALTNAGVHNVESRLYPGHRHEILNLIHDEQPRNDLFNWLNRVPR